MEINIRLQFMSGRTRLSEFGGRGGVFSLSRVRGQQGSNKVQGFSVVRALNSLGEEFVGSSGREWWECVNLVGKLECLHWQQNFVGEKVVGVWV
ncbi:hypothetical protein ACLOJK_029388 [Asimina triloba]